MKLLNELYNLIKPSSTDKGAKEMTYPNVYKVKDIGGKRKIRKEKVVMRNSLTGQVYGRRTVYQKNT